jgi:Ecdysteroid kinase-like family
MGKAGITSEMGNDRINQIVPPTECAPKIERCLSAEEIPSWLNEAFIQDILQKHDRNQDLRVKSLQIQQCGGKGDSYASMMYRIGTTFFDLKAPDSIISQSLIAKTLPELDLALEKLGAGNYNVQDKEMEMYEKVLPEFERLLKSIDEDADIFPKVLGVDRSYDVIILEDLQEKKFVMENRLLCLDLDHVLMALRKLARMHAASAVVNQRNPSALKNIDTGFFTRKTDSFHVMFESLCDAMLGEVATWEGFEHYAKKLVNVRKSLVKNAQRAFDCDEGDFHVLNHGDLWTNNLMYSYDDSGALADCVLLDFQFAAFGSPALDLIVRLCLS